MTLNYHNRKLIQFRANQISILVSLLSSITFSTSESFAFPEFQSFAEKHSGRIVNCSMCHMNDNGPNGNDDGQLGSLNDKEMAQVNAARVAIEPGQDVDSPILNKFGNHIVNALGTKKILEMQGNPEKLVEALGNQSDLDGDGIPDSKEFADGTDPLNKYHGDPWLLFINNLSKYRFDAILAFLSILIIIFGLSNLVKGLNTLANHSHRR